MRAVSPIVRFPRRLETSSGWFTASTVAAASSTSSMKGASGSVTRATGNRPRKFVSSNTRSNSPSGVSWRAQGDSPARASRSASAFAAPVSVSVHGVRISMRPEATVASCRRMPSSAFDARLAAGSASAAGSGAWSWPPSGTKERDAGRSEAAATFAAMAVDSAVGSGCSGAGGCVGAGGRDGGGASDRGGTSKTRS